MYSYIKQGRCCVKQVKVPCQPAVVVRFLLVIVAVFLVSLFFYFGPTTQRICSIPLSCTPACLSQRRTPCSWPFTRTPSSCYFFVRSTIFFRCVFCSFLFIFYFPIRFFIRSVSLIFFLLRVFSVCFFIFSSNFSSRICTVPSLPLYLAFSHPTSTSEQLMNEGNYLSFPFLFFYPF